MGFAGGDASVTMQAQDDARWLRSYPFTKRIEGRYVNDPKDPGGPTYAGVSHRAVVRLDVDKDGRLDFDIDGDGDVDADDIRALEKHPLMVERFYRDMYWNVVRAGEMRWPWCLLAFDAAVHHGPGPAVVLVQRGLGVVADGKVGKDTLAAVDRAGALAIRRYTQERIVLFQRIEAKRQGGHFAGWTSRALQLHEVAMERDPIQR